MTRRSEAKVFVAGVGTTQYGNLAGWSECDLGVWALNVALEDAGLKRNDVDALIASRIPDVQTLGELTGVNPKYAVNVLGQGRNTGPAIAQAVQLITSGFAHTVALVYGNNGRSGGTQYGGPAGFPGTGGDEFWFPWGMTSLGAYHALLYQRYCEQYGATPEDLAEVAVTFRQHAALNEAAVMRKPMSADEYKSGRFIVEPLRLFDYCLVADGGVAMILTSGERARDLRSSPVEVLGAASRCAFENQGMPPADYWRDPMQSVAKELTSRTGVRPGDVEAVMIYDNFTPVVLYQLEGFGFCPFGEAAKWVQKGRLSLSGDLPTNTSGGHLSEAYLQGWNLNVEAVKQLRGECGARQLNQPKLIQYLHASPIVSSVLYGRP